MPRGLGQRRDLAAEQGGTGPVLHIDGPLLPAGQRDEQVVRVVLGPHLGLEPQAAELLFQPQFRLSGSGDKQAQGTGQREDPAVVVLVVGLADRRGPVRRQRSFSHHQPSSRVGTSRVLHRPQE